ncbi:MAG: peptidase [Proteobacteria bacterium]|nr:peptidase [Pseudomonadota bacterium]
MSLLRLFVILSPALVAGCALTPARLPTRVGADADAHGCRASAGYMWCARTAACERSWELAAQQGLAEPGAAAAWCAADPQGLLNR